MKRLKASFTVEAAIVLPVVILAAAAFSLSMKMMSKQTFTETIALESQLQLTKECSELLRDKATQDIFIDCTKVSTDDPVGSETKEAFYDYVTVPTRILAKEANEADYTAARSSFMAMDKRTVSAGLGDILAYCIEKNVSRQLSEQKMSGQIELQCTARVNSEKVDSDQTVFYLDCTYDIKVKAPIKIAGLGEGVSQRRIRTVIGAV